MSWLLFYISIVTTITGGYMMRNIDQKTRDNGRKTYRLFFPEDLQADAVTAWVRSMSGTLKSNSVLEGTPSIVFEVWSTSKGIEHLLKVPWQHADYVIAQLLAHVPGLSYAPEADIPRRLWTRSVELGLSNTGRPLRIYSPASVSASILAAMQSMDSGEAVMLQWIVTPARPTRLPQDGDDKDDLADRRQKLAEPNVMAVLRVASTAATKPRADHLISRTRSALTSTGSPTTRFVMRKATSRMLEARIASGTTPIVFGMQLSAPELTALLAWPIGSPMIAGLPAFTGKRLPPTEQVPSTGMVIGTSTFPGAERPVAIGYQEALMHTHVLGKTGTGKSNVLAHMARQIMNDGYGLILLEAEGNLYQSVLDYVPRDRIEDVVLLDVADTMHPVGFNIFDQGNPLAVVDQVIELFQHKYGDGGGVWLQEFLYFAMRTITETPGLAFTDLATLLVPRTEEEIEFVDNVTRNLKDEELRRWWQRQDNRDRKQQQQRSDPVMSRIWQIASRPELRHIMGQGTSAFNIAQMMQDNKILLVNLKGVSSGAADLAGTLLMNAIWQATKTTTKQRPTYVMLDEFGSFMDLPIGLENMFAQARKHNVGFIVANQNMTQLAPAMRDAVVTNTRNKVVMQVNSDDARTLIREMGNQLEPIDLTHLPVYEAMAQVMAPIGSSRPVSIRTEPPRESTKVSGRVVAHSRKTYSRPVAVVRQEMIDRVRSQKTANTRRPRISGLDG